MSKIQLGVMFGSRTCEHEVSIISAVQLMRNVNLEKYDVIPVYIDEHGAWYTGEALKRMESYSPFRPDMAEHEIYRRIYEDVFTRYYKTLIPLHKRLGALTRRRRAGAPGGEA